MSDIFVFLIKILRETFGDTFIQPLVLLGIFLIALNKGVRSIQDWIEEKILSPYLIPFVTKLNAAVDIQTQHTEQLFNQGKRLHDTEVNVAILQGKVLGGTPRLDR